MLKEMTSSVLSRRRLLSGAALLGRRRYGGRMFERADR